MTQYILYKNGEKVFQNKNIACFAEIMGYETLKNPTTGENINAKNKEEYSLEFLADTSFSPKKASTIDKKKIKKFLLKCRSFGIKASVREQQNLEIWHSFARKRTDISNFLIRLNFKDFESVNFIKFALHALRPLLEDTGALDDFLKNTPKLLDNWQYFRICHAFKHAGHNSFGSLFYADYSDRQYSIKIPKKFKEDVKNLPGPFYSVITRFGDLNFSKKKVKEKELNLELIVKMTRENK